MKVPFTFEKFICPFCKIQLFILKISIVHYKQDQHTFLIEESSLAYEIFTFFGEQV